MLRYQLLDDVEEPVIDHPHRHELLEYGLQWSGAYRVLGADGKETIVGDVFVDEEGSTCVVLALHEEPLTSRTVLGSSAQTELEDGTIVTTEGKPSGVSRAFASGALVPVPGISIRLAAVETIGDLLDAHVEHVEEVRAARGGPAIRFGANASAYVAARREAQRRHGPVVRIQIVTGVVCGVVVAAVTYLVILLANLPPELGPIPMVLGALSVLGGMLFVGPPVARLVYRPKSHLSRA